MTLEGKADLKLQTRSVPTLVRKLRTERLKYALLENYTKPCNCRTLALAPFLNQKLIYFWWLENAFMLFHSAQWFCSPIIVFVCSSHMSSAIDTGKYNILLFFNIFALCNGKRTGINLMSSCIKIQNDNNVRDNFTFEKRYSCRCHCTNPWIWWILFSNAILSH